MIQGKKREDGIIHVCPGTILFDGMSGPAFFVSEQRKSRVC